MKVGAATPSHGLRASKLFSCVTKTHENVRKLSVLIYIVYLPLSLLAEGSGSELKWKEFSRMTEVGMRESDVA